MDHNETQPDVKIKLRHLSVRPLNDRYTVAEILAFRDDTLIKSYKGAYNMIVYRYIVRIHNMFCFMQGTFK